MERYFSSAFTLGILGGGQLGKMLLHETQRLDIRTAVMDPSSDAPCRAGASRFEVGNLKDFDAVYRFGKQCNVLTIEIEHVNVDALEALEAEGIKVFPAAALLRTVQDKQQQKLFYQQHAIPTAPFEILEGNAGLKEKVQTYPLVWKAAKGGYDGRGVQVLKSEADLALVPDVPGLLEAHAGEMTEISVIVGRSPSGEVVCYPPVEMVFHPTANLVEYLYSPARIDTTTADRAREIALAVADAFSLVGILAIELFVRQDGEIWVNEVAPRPHNSGHQTIESNYTSQYEQHLRAILDLPLGSVNARSASVMINLLGAPGQTGPVRYNGVSVALNLEGVYVHIYGKPQTRPFRKMGHVTIVADDLETARKKADIVKYNLTVQA